MNNHDLILHQQHLLRRSSNLRADLAVQGQVLKKPLSQVEQIKDGWGWLRSHPQWPMGAAVVLLLVRPRKTLVWGGRLWWGWQTYKRIHGWIETNAPKLMR